jgi:hypothetical protein
MVGRESTGTAFSAPHIIQVSLFYCLCGVMHDSYQENLLVLVSESCSSCWEPASDSGSQVYYLTHCVIPNIPLLNGYFGVTKILLFIYIVQNFI